MRLFDLKGPAEALEDLYDKEFAAVRSAQFDVLARLAAEKDRLTAAVSSARPDGAALQRLAHKAERNQALLTAAGQGVRRALSRIEALHRRAPLQTYDSTGTLRPPTETTHALTHKA